MSAQTPGAPHLNFFSLDAIGAKYSIQDIAQDTDGLIYLVITEEESVLVFDGANWTSIKVPGVISICGDTQGRIWTGGHGGIGYLAKNQWNQVEHSDFAIPNEDLEGESFVFGFPTETGVRLANRTFCIDIDTTGNDPKATTTQVDEDEIYLSLKEEDLCVLNKSTGTIYQTDGSYKKIICSNIQQIDFIGFVEDKLVAAANSFRELGQLVGNQFIPFQNEFLSQDLAINWVDSIDGKIAACINNDFVMMDVNGRVEYRIGRDSGIFGAVQRFGVFRDGRIWIVTSGGFATLDAHGPVRSWPLIDELLPSTYHMSFLNDQLYASTSQGLAIVDLKVLEEGWPQNSFRVSKQVECGVVGQGDRLFLASMIGLFEITDDDDNRLHKIYDGIFNQIFADDSESQANLFLLDQDQKLSILKHSGKGVELVNSFTVDGWFYLVNKLSDKVYLVYTSRGYELMRFPDGLAGEPTFTPAGIPDESLIEIVRGKTVCMEDGQQWFVEYKSNEVKLEACPWFSEFDSDYFADGVWSIVDCGNFGAGFYFSDSTLAVLPWDGEKYTSDPIWKIQFGEYWDSDLLIWDSMRQCIWGVDGNHLCRLNVRENYEIPTPKIFVSAESESMVQTSQSLTDQGPNRPLPAIEANGGLTFNYGFINRNRLTSDQPKYQFKLEGYDADWSEYSEKSTKEYTNLPGGLYHFNVRGIESGGVAVEQTLGPIRVETIWYLQTWATALWVTIGMAAIYGVVLLRTSRLKTAKEKMEMIVQQRTNELRIKERESEAERLMSFDTLVAGIAHDFNNLLMVISANNELITMVGNKQVKDCAERSMKATESAVELCSELTSYTDNTPLQLIPVDIDQLVRESTGVLQKSLPVKIEMAAKDDKMATHVMGDVGQLKRCLVNLVVNAGEAARSQVDVSVRERFLSAQKLKTARFVGESPESGKHLCIRVEDDGNGLNEDVEQ
ncbi:MAG: triple tyrosine motif-containing protein, partial [Planctomycetota bacterium]